MRHHRCGGCITPAHAMFPLPQWYEAAAPLHNYMAALRLAPGLDSIESAVVLQCSGLHSRRQKNFQPLQLAGSGELLFVTDTLPLTVVRSDLVSGACQVVLDGSTATASTNSSKAGEADAAVAASDGSSNTAAAPAAAAAATAALAVLGGAHAHGGSPYVHLDGHRYLRCAPNCWLWAAWRPGGGRAG